MKPTISNSCKQHIRETLLKLIRYSRGHDIRDGQNISDETVERYLNEIRGAAWLAFWGCAITSDEYTKICDYTRRVRHKLETKFQKAVN